METARSSRTSPSAGRASRATSVGLGLSLLLHLAVLVTLGRVDITPLRVLEHPP